VTTSLGGVTLPNASKIAETVYIVANETVLLSGKRKIQAEADTGFGATYECMGTKAQFDAIKALVGSSCTLVTEDGSYSKCYLFGEMPRKETENPNVFVFTVTVRQDTS
jgi:hypothetical protein